MLDNFGDRMKLYEKLESKRFMPLLPVCVRLDGKCFGKFTRGLARPYDVRLSVLMQETTKYLVEETNACMGYTQSDEITLVFYSDRGDSQIFCGGKLQKMNSILASMCTAYFSLNLSYFIDEREDCAPLFDCRVWQVPNLTEAANVFLWRELDATKNSVSMACREHYSHKQMMNLGRSDQMELLFKAGVNWNDYPTFFKRGTYTQRRNVLKKFSSLELGNLPERHEAKQNPNIEIIRSEVRVLDMPIFTKVTNREGVIFRGEEPIVLEDSGK